MQLPVFDKDVLPDCQYFAITTSVWKFTQQSLAL